MKKIHKQRLAKLAITLLENSKNKTLTTPGGRKIEFNMGKFASFDDCEDHDEVKEVNQGGTSCCFLGYAPCAFPAVRKMDSWSKVSKYVIGKDFNFFGDDEFFWDFLFSEEWNSDPKQAARRALYSLRDEDLTKLKAQIGVEGPNIFDVIDKQFYTSYSDKKTIEELKKYVAV